MLAHPYSYHFFGALREALASLPGIASMLILFSALLTRLRTSEKFQTLRRPMIALLIIVGLATLTYAFYTAVIETDTSSELILTAKEFPDDADCGTAWTIWITSGIGMTNPCKRGCYRGVTLKQQWRMSGFPPWPENRREFQCWARKPLAAKTQTIAPDATAVIVPPPLGESPVQ